MLKEGQIRIPSGCAIAGVFSRSGEAMTGEDIIQSIEVMHDRSNGLGGGFAGYGIYPEFADYYAFHLFYDDPQCQKKCENYLERRFSIVSFGEIPTKKVPAIKDEPLIYRYFLLPLPDRLKASQYSEAEYVSHCALSINEKIDGAYVFSSGKNMGIFKANGFPEDVGRFYQLQNYAGYCWTAHGRYPTNTPGWWGGAHPFGLLDYSVVHNGEISSYDANRRFLEMFGYKHSLQTDTEAITYIVDYLHRKLGLTLEETANVMAAPFWSTIQEMPSEQREHFTFLRKRFGPLLVTGPFSIILGYSGGMMVLGDRLKLRSMVCGDHEDRFYAASEESAIRAICPDISGVWSPASGEAVIVELNL